MAHMLLAQSGDLTIPDTAAGRVVWVVVLAMFLGIYLLVSRTRRRAREHYLDARRREAELRAADPDMRKDQ